MRTLYSLLQNRCQDLMISEIFKRRRTYCLFVLLIIATLANVGYSQTAVQNFGTGTGSHTSQTASTSFIPNPTGSGTTYTRAGATAPNAPIVMATASNPLATTDTYIRAVASSTGSVSKFSPWVGYTGSTEFYTSFKILFGDASAGSTATSGVWSFFQGSGAMFSDNNNFTGTQVFSGLQFTYGAGGTVALTYRAAGSWVNTGLSESALSSATLYTIEIVGNNKTSGAINYTYDGNPQSVAVQKYDLYLNGSLIGDDLAEAQLAANASIGSGTFIGLNSASNVANIFVDDVVTYNAVPVAIGSCPDADEDTVCDDVDNCPFDENVDQTDNDGDGLGNPCDNCPNSGLNPDQTDTDGDAIGDLCDNCLTVSNEDQTDTDDDGIGDECDTCTDIDGDGVGDAGFNNTTCAVSNGPDNCPYIPNPDQIDSDGDGTGDQCELCTFPAAPESGDSDADGIGDECDNCPEEPNAIQVDTDSDLTGDACDGCPFDPNKIAPGLCGCGVVDSETDTDGDFTPDCNDGCPNDPMKINPGTCGCGNSEPGTPCDDGNAGTIMDAIDGSCNCVGVPAECMVNGDCPPTDADPCTIEVCGGGMCQTVTLPDTDGDGACDAIDGCPNDPNKTSGGFCGCGNPETGDSDGDGAPDCVDGCPMDPNKIAPGVCGCGVADTDGDGDGTPDCNDGCPMDPDKTTPGECGCDVADTDTDGDGFVDCIDGCPFNPDLIVPGICGCSTDDVDNDGVLDCVDACPLNPDLIELTVCGDCTIPIDTDGDGFVDCIDGCPNDPNKVAAGVCGCGVADTDTDEDGTADCVDGCPMDPNKTTPGECGCGVADTDTDEDGTADCNDGCPMDPNKVAAGVCGCGVADTDGDGDGTADCDDDCPMDPDKITPGVCGCGVADTDGDGDGTADCDDDCPMDPNKITPGVCGCGVADTDGDGDGTADCDDLCPAGPEPGTPCDDGSACTENDVIQSDCSCAGTPVTCDDGNPCTSTECDPMVGCLFISYDTDEDGVCDALDLCNGSPEPGTPCDDGSACTENDVIQSDCSCAGTPVTCDDGNPCTSTECDPMVGCLFISYDTDEDGICDEFDNCPDDANTDQTDSDGDGLGDACDECPYAVDGIENFDEENCRCNQGYYAVTGGIGDLTGSGSRGAVPVTITGCQPCQPGYYCPDGLGAYPCPVNTYIDLQAAVVCLPCAEGYTSQQGSVACELIANCDDGIMNGDEDGVDCGGTNCAPCSPPNAVCGVITVYVNPNIYDYDGPGSQNIWLIDSSYLDAGSTYDSEEPSIKVKRYLSNITFNWTTNGACIDESPNGVINNPDKGIVYRSCYPAIPADLNKNKLYRLLISDDFGSDECSGTVKVIQQSGAFTAPSVHFVIPDNEEYISIARPQFQLLDGDASIVSDLIAIPNPGSHSLHLRWNAETSGDIEIRIIDMSGRLAVLQPYEVISGQNMVMFDMSAQPSGMYAILIQTDTEVISTKWFKD